jgi:hypothetical protein
VLESAARRVKVVVRLDTHEALTEAVALYRSLSDLEVAPYGENPRAAHRFEWAHADRLANAPHDRAQELRTAPLAHLERSARRT